MSYMGSRYQSGRLGRFISEDPVFIALGADISRFGVDIGNLLTDPQSLNSYSYARNNPLKYIDPTGLYNVKTGAIEKGDTLNKITDIINQQNSTNYSVSTIAELNDISDINHIEVGQKLIPNITTPDITNNLNDLMVAHGQESSILGPAYFISKVATNHEWDLKNNSGYDSKLFSDGFVYAGTHVPSDAPGNIHYGYVGNKTPGLNPLTLTIGSIGAQVIFDSIHGGLNINSLQTSIARERNDIPMIYSGTNLMIK